MSVTLRPWLTIRHGEAPLIVSVPHAGTQPRFKDGWITRTYGQPLQGVHALQMELACRAYMDEPNAPLQESNWPPPYSEQRAASVRGVLRDVLQRCIEFARKG